MGVAYNSTLPGECRGVEIFAVGLFKDRRWTLSELIEIVKNTDRLKKAGILQAPLVTLGHERDEENRRYVEALLERSDLPKTGDVTNLRVIGDPLMRTCGHYLAKVGCPKCEQNARMLADFLNVAPAIADIINRRAFDRVSSEIYNPLVYDGKDYGICLRAVSLLGGELPAVKGLADIPMAVPMGQGSKDAAGAPRGNHKDGPPLVFRACERKSCVFTFKERTMNREQMLAKLQELGFDTSQITEAVPDVVLAEMIRVSGQGGAGAAPAQVQAGGDGQSREELLAALASKSDEELKALLGGCGAVKASDGVAMHAETKKVAAQVQASQAQLAALDRLITQRMADEKKASFAAFSEGLKAQGVPPAVFQNGKVQALYMSLDQTKVATFGDKKDISQADAFKAVLEEMAPIIKFSDKLNMKPGTSAADDEQRLKSHFAAHGEDLLKSGVTEEKLVSAYKKAKAADPKMTVERYVSK